MQLGLQNGCEYADNNNKPAECPVVPLLDISRFMREGSDLSSMRICIINEFFYPDSTGGTGTVLSSLARSLKEKFGPISLDVITSSNLYRQPDADLPTHEDWDGISIYRLATPKPNGVSTVRRLIANLHFSLVALVKLLRLGNYDLVLVGTGPPMVAMAAHVFKRMTGTPFVYIVYDLEPDRSVIMKIVGHDNIFTRAFRYHQKLWLHSAETVVVLGRCMKEYLGRTYGLSPQQVSVIPIGSDANEIMPQATASRFRHENSLDGFVVLYSGNFGRYHNFDTILDAARELQVIRPEVSFVLVGNGAQKQHIQQRIASEQLGNVRMFDFVAQDDYADLLAAADISLVTLEHGMEGLCVPSKFYSILASGRPTIAMVSPQSEVAYVIRDSECGVQVNQTDVQMLVNTIIHLAENPAVTQRMGANARRALVEEFSAEITAQKYYTAFEAAVRQSAQIVPGTRRRASGVFRFRPSVPVKNGRHRPEPAEHL